MIFPNDDDNEITFHTFTNSNAVSIRNDSMDNIENNDEIRVFEDEVLGEFIVISSNEKIPKICIYSGSITAVPIVEMPSSFPLEPKIHWGLINLNEKFFQADVIFNTTDGHHTLYIKHKVSSFINLINVSIFDSFSVNLPLDYFGMIIITDVYTRNRKQVCILSGMNFHSEMIFNNKELFIAKETRLLRLDLLIFKKNNNVMVNLINNAV